MARDLPWQLTSAVEKKSPEEVRALMTTHGPFSRVQLYELLETAVFYGRNDNVQLLLTSGAVVNRRYKTSADSLLHIACRQANASLVEILLNNGADTSITNENNQTALHIAVEKNLYASTKLILKHRGDVNAVDDDNNSPLYIAVSNGFFEIVKLLLSDKANVNCVWVHKKGNTPLHLAVDKGYDAIVASLLKNNAFVDTLIEGGFTPLHLAAKSNSFNISKILLNYSANINAVTLVEKMTPLHFACKSGNEEMVKLFIEKGAVINALANLHQTPLHMACEDCKVGIVRLLLNNGADPNIDTPLGENSLYIACKGNNKEIVELILNKEVDVNTVSINNNTPLHVACRNGNLDIIRLLLRKGANVKTRGEKNMTPLHVAAEYCEVSEIVEELLNYGGDVNDAVLGIKYTPLHYAAESGFTDVVKVLLSRGADIEALTGNNESPLLSAISHKNLDVVQVLLENGAKSCNDNQSNESLEMAIMDGNLEMFELILKYCPNLSNENNKENFLFAISSCPCPEIVTKLMERGLKVEPGDEKDEKLLNEAVEKGFISIVEDLLKFGADVNVPDIVLGATPLHNSTMHQDMNITQLLLKYGANINAVDKMGHTPIRSAVVKGNLKMAKFLLSNKASVDHEMLKIAFQAENMEMVELLLQHGADINGCDETGKTLLHFAVIDSSTEEHEILKIILSKGVFIDAQTYGENILQDALSNSYNQLYSSIVELNRIHPEKEAKNTKNGLTALHLAVLEDNEEVAEILLESGAKVDIATKHGITALYMAAQLGNVEIMELLLDHYADVNTRDVMGRTPLHVATEEGYLKAVQLLYKYYGADLDIKCVENQTALCVAEEGIEDCENATRYNDAEYSGENPYNQIVNYLRGVSRWSDVCYKSRIEEIFNQAKISSNDILSKNVNLHARAARNRDILNILEYEVRDRYGYCYDVLVNRFLKGVERNKLMECAPKSFCVVFSDMPGLPQDCIENILSYLNNEDLRCLNKTLKE